MLKPTELTDAVNNIPGMVFAQHAGMRVRGVSLVELIVFIAIIGVSLADILGVMNYTTRASAQPLVQKQALAIAEAYLEEILAMPFTYCDPDDPAAATAANTAACATPETALAAEGGETRGNSTTPYDNVNDYASLPAGPPAAQDSPGTPITGLAGYTVSVAVASQALSTVPAAASLRVTVTVTGPANTTVRLDGYRTRYSPNTLP